MVANAKREILIDAENLRSDRDFYSALAEVLGSEGWHGLNADAFLETMVYHLDSHSVQPPYRIVVRNADGDLRNLASKFSDWLQEARKDRVRNSSWVDDIDVELVVE